MSLSSKLYEAARHLCHFIKQQMVTRADRLAACAARHSRSSNVAVHSSLNYSTGFQANQGFRLLDMLEPRLYMSSNSLTFDFASEDAFVGIQQGSRFLIAGQGSDQWSVYRLDGNGASDTSFGDLGRAVVNPGKDAQLADISFDASGHFLLAGRTGGDMLIARFHADGQLDDSFGDDGRLVIDLGGDDFINSLTVVGDQIYAVGGSDHSAIILKIVGDGELDASFGTGGAYEFNIKEESEALALEVQSDGRLLVAARGIGSDTSLSVARLLPNGQLDYSYGSEGLANSAETKSPPPDYERLVEGMTTAAIEPDPSASFVPLDVTLVAAPGLEPDGYYSSPFQREEPPASMPLMASPLLSYGVQSEVELSAWDLMGPTPSEGFSGGSSMMLSIPSGFTGPIVFDPDGAGDLDPVDHFYGFDWSIGEVLAVGQMTALQNYLATATALTFGGNTYYVGGTATLYEKVTINTAAAVLGTGSIAGMNTDFAYRTVSGIDMNIIFASISGNSWSILTAKAPSGGSWFEVYYKDLTSGNSSLYNDGTLIYASTSGSASGSLVAYQSSTYSALDSGHTGLYSVDSSGAFSRSDTTTYYNPDFLSGVTPLIVLDRHSISDGMFTPIGGNASDYFVLDPGGASVAPATLAGAGAPTDSVLGIGTYNGKINSISGPSMQGKTDGGSTIYYAYRLVENSDHVVEVEQSTTRLSHIKSISFSFKDLGFDTTGNQGEMLDAFEAALVDAQGRSLVGTIGLGKDVFFNITDGLDPVLGAGATYSAGIVTLDVSHVPVGTVMYLKTRLVNNDQDTETAVTIIPGISGSTTPVAAASLVTPVPPASSAVTIERIGQLSDVSGLVEYEHLHTTIDHNSDTVFAGINLMNVSEQSLRGPVLLAVRMTGGAQVSVADPDGYTPEGLPYFNLTDLAAATVGEIWEEDETILGGELRFHNPDRVQFDYELIVLAHVNEAPVFTSTPDTEAVAGGSYVYMAHAVDPENDTVSYELVTGPGDLEIDDETGEVTWSPSTSHVGDHVVIVRATDSFGAVAVQTYALRVVNGVPNRPPIFTSVPIVDAYVGEEYLYQASAADADGDELTFDGEMSGEITDEDFEVSTTGEVTWTPDAEHVGQLVEMTVTVEDDHSPAGVAEQTYLVYVHAARGNHSPIIVSAAETATHPSASYAYQVVALDPDADELSYALVDGHPSGMSINEDTGLISWSVPSNASGSFEVEVVVSDGRGGIDRQQFEVQISGAARIEGRVWNDVDADGVQDGGEAGLSGVTVYLDLNFNQVWDPGEPWRVSLSDDPATSEVDESGEYLFESMELGSYVIRQVVPAGYEQTYPGEVEPTDEVIAIELEDFVPGSFTPITFSEFSVSTSITTQYLAGYGVEFGGFFDGQRMATSGEVPPGANPYGVVVGLPDGPVEIDTGSPTPFITTDGANPTSPVLSGTPTYNGPIAFLFDELQVSFGIDAGYFDSIGSTAITAYGEDGEILGQVTNDSTGITFLGFASADGSTPLIKAVLFHLVGAEASGFALDNLRFGVTGVPSLTGGHTAFLTALHTVDDDNHFGIRQVETSSDDNPVFATVPPTVATVDHVYSYDSHAYSPVAAALVYELVVAPDGMVIESQTGMIAWRPTFEQQGPHSIVVRARDPEGRAVIQSFDIQVRSANIAPRFTSTPPAAAAEGIEFVYLLAASDLNGDIVSFRLVEGPTGMEIEEGGVLTWTPADEGDYRVMIAASDGRGGVVAQSFVLPVRSTAPPIITTAPEGPALVGTEWSYEIEASDPDGGAVTISLDAASLARGMALDDGELSWTPSVAGDYPVTITVTDDDGESATQTFTLAVRAPVVASLPPVFTSSPTGPAVGEVEWTYELSAVDPDDEGAVTFALVGSSYPSGFALVGGDTLEWTPPSSAGPEHVDVTVSATDADGVVTYQSFRLPVRYAAPSNQAPELTSAPIMSVRAGEIYSYQLTAIDPNSDDLTYSIDSAPAGVTIDPDAGLLRWAAQVIGSYNIAIRVTDTADNYATQEYTLTVLAPVTRNTSPVITSIPTGPAVADRPWQYTVKASDANEDTLTYTLDSASLARGITINSATGLVNWTPEEGGSFHITVTATDTHGGQGAQTFTLPVIDNAPPVILSAAVHIASLSELYEYEVDAEDPNEGDELTYALEQGPSWLAINAETGVLSGTPTLEGQLGLYEVIVVVTDQDGAEARQTFDLYVIDESDNQPPVIATGVRNVIQVGQTLVHQVAAFDPDGDALTYTLIDPPSGMTMDDRGLITWTPISSQVTELGTPRTYTVEVDDGENTPVTQQFSVEVFHQFINHGPQITSSPSGSAAVGSLYRYIATATDADGDALTWLLEQGPAGMTINSATGEVRWQPLPSQVGAQSVRLTVADAYGATSTQTFTLPAYGTNLPPMILSTPPTQVREGVAYSYAVEAMDPEGGPLTWSLISPPTGATINDEGLLSWAGDVDGNYTFTIQATDERGASVRQVFTLVITPAEANQTPVIESAPDTYVLFVGQPWSYLVDASDPEDGTTTLTVTGPTGMAFDGTTLNLLEWTPTASPSQLGRHEVLVRSEDGDGGFITQMFSLFVVDNDGPVITEIGNATISAGGLFRVTALAADPEGDALSYALDATSLSLGMTIDGVGRITWLTETGDVDVDPYEVTVTVTDIYGQQDSEVFEITVSGDTSDPDLVMHVSAASVSVGDQIVFKLAAIDNVGIARVELVVDGINVPLLRTEAGWQGLFIATETGTIDVSAKAFDAAGNDTLITTSITVTAATNAPGYVAGGGVNAPQIALGTPQVEQVITEPIDIVGSVIDDDDDLISYTLELVPVGGGTTITIASVGSALAPAAEVSNAVLGRLDPTLVANGDYMLVLTAIDDEEHESIIEQPITIDSLLKLGNFRLSFTDLSLPMAGVPITIGRTYDTLNADVMGDFGYGWSLDLFGLKVETDLDGENDLDSIGVLQPFRSGTQVHITLPDGTRESFHLQPDLLSRATIYDEIASGYLAQGGLFRATFAPAPGSGTTSTLEFTRDRVEIYVDPQTGVVYSPDRIPFNPASPLLNLDYKLTTRDGTTFIIDGITGKLRNINDRNGNTLTASADGITTRTPDGQTIAQIQFQRDYLNRIVKIIDPAGLATTEDADDGTITYTYDSEGDLVAVTDRSGQTTELIYDAPQAHYLTQIIDSRGITVMDLEFDENTGRIISLTDASGEDIPFSYDLNSRPGEYRETLSDAFGVTTEMVRDSRGNVIRRIQQSELTPNENPALRTYVVTVYEYTHLGGNDHQTAESIPFEVTGDHNKYDAQPTAWQTRRTVDASGQVLTVTDALGNISRYTYDRFGSVLSTTDALGNTTHNAYDPRGNLTSTTDAAGNRTSFAYSASGNLTEVRDSANRIVSTFDYDTQGRITSSTASPDTGSVTTYFAYDANGNQTRSWYTDPDSGDKIITETEYDADGRVIAMRQLIDPDGVTGETVLSESSTTYNSTGQVLTSTDPFGHVSQNYYDKRGLLIMTRSQVVDENGSDKWLVSLTVYDANGRPVFSADPFIEDDSAPVTGERTVFASETVYDALGRVVTTRRLENLTISVDADGTVHETLIDEGDEGDELWSTSTTYDAQGRVTVSTSPTGATTEYVYDIAGNLLELTTDLDGNPGTATDRATTTYTYDALGRQTSVTDALNHTTRFTHDALGRVIRTTYHDDTYTETEYDEVGRRVAETDQLGRTTNYEYDDAGRLEAVELPAVFDADPLSLTFEELVRPRYEYGYDTRGNMTTITDPKGRVTTFTFDAFNRQTSRELPLGQTESMQYNDLGQLTLHIDFEDRHTAYIYDEYGLLEEKQYFIDAANYDDGEGTPDRTIEYTYDSFGRTLEIDDSVDGVTLYAYDAQGRLTQVDRIDATDESIINYAYNDLRQLTRTWTSTDTAGLYKITEIVYAYDELGRLETITQAWRNSIDITDEATSYIYDSIGNLSKIDNPNGVVANYDYDALNRLVELTHFKDADSDLMLDGGEDIVARFEYVLNALGHRLSAVEAFDANNDGDLDASQTFTWEYDGLNRLVSETFNSPNNTLDYSTEYAFDLSSNRMLSTTIDTSGTETITYEYDDNDRLLEEVSSDDGTTSYAYNDAGDQISKTTPGGTTNYHYDVMGRMIGVDTDNDTIDDITYIYDSSGVRVAQSENSDTRTYVYDRLNPTGYAKPIEEYVDGVLDRSYTIGLMIHNQWDAANGALQFLHDGHNSTRALLDVTADIAEQYTFRSFGEAIGFDAATAFTSWLMPDGSHDVGTGFTYNLARWREGARFTSLDSYPGRTIDPLSLHKYQYVHGNPTSGTDPLGLFTIPEMIVTAAVISTLIGIVVSSPFTATKDAIHNHRMQDESKQTWYFVSPGVVIQDRQFASDNPGKASMFQFYIDDAYQRAKTAHLGILRGQEGHLWGAEQTANLVGGELGAAASSGLFGGMAWAGASMGPAGFSNPAFGTQVHQKFLDALVEQTGIPNYYWKMQTAPGIKGVDAEYIGPPSLSPGFKYAELKPASWWGYGQFMRQLDNWNLPTGQTQLWLYNHNGVIGSTGWSTYWNY